MFYYLQFSSLYRVLALLLTGLFSFQGAAYNDYEKANFTIECMDASYHENGELILKQYFDKVVLDETNENFKNINRLIEEECDAFMANAEDVTESVTDDDFLSSGEVYENYSDADVTNNDDGILSIRMDTYWWLGGVSNHNVYGLNYNLRTGEKLALADVFDMSESEIEEYLKKKTKEYINSHPDMNWWDDDLYNAIDIVDEYTLDQFQYYIEGDKICICYSVYELGPGAMGCVVVPCRITTTEYYR